MLQNAYVGLGSNLGNRAGYLLLAVRGMLDAGLDVIRLSHIYETAAVENEHQPAFLNMVAEVRTVSDLRVLVPFGCENTSSADRFKPKSKSAYSRKQINKSK